MKDNTRTVITASLNAAGELAVIKGTRRGINAGLLGSAHHHIAAYISNDAATTTDGLEHGTGTVISSSDNLEGENELEVSTG